MIAMLRRFTLVAFVLAMGTMLVAAPAAAEVLLPSVIQSNMVLQRDMKVPVYGWAYAGEKVTVTFAGQTKTTMADAQGRWMVHLDPLEASSTPSKMTVQGKNEITLDNILVGEVWICSGQSNMQWTVQNSNNPEAEIAAAKYPKIRLFQVPLKGTQEPQYDTDAQWQACSPETVPGFSAVGYFFGRKIHQELDVPVGLIQTCWGGSAAEAWVRREILENAPEYAELMARWEKLEAEFDYDAERKKYEEQTLPAWQEAAKKAKDEGKKAPPRPRAPRDVLTGQHRPANLYNGMLLPVMPYGIRGAIWYQGESNAGRAYQYRTLFPTMIENWREDWGQGDFPFYFVQLANFMARADEPTESAWAELREAQTMTLRLPNTGQAITIDIGEADDIHPRNKQDVGLRLALVALHDTYGMEEVTFSGPKFKSMDVEGSRAVLSFDHVDGGLVAKGGAPLVGFAIAGEDKNFVWAEAKIEGDQVVVASEKVEKPVAVRYAWADNPACNLYNEAGLPAVPFRTDDWPGVTIDSK